MSGGTSDKEIKETVNKMLTVILGVSSETAERIEKIIKEKGELNTLRKHYRKLTGEVRGRISKDIERAEKQDKSKEENKSDSKETKEKEEKEKEKKEKEKKDVKESVVSGSFMKYFLSEEEDNTVMMDVRPEDIRDPEKRRDAKIAQRKQKNKGAKLRAIREKILQLRQEMKDIQSGKTEGGM
jgi:hypothetical protein